jgi:hypothetical protein
MGKKRLASTSRIPIKGDPFWFSPFLDILSALGSLATIVAFIIEMIKLARKREEAHRITDLENKYEELRFQFLKYQDNTRRLFHLLNQNDEGFRTSTVGINNMRIRMDKSSYRLYTDIRHALRNTKIATEDILAVIELSAIEEGLDIQESEILTRLNIHLTAILEGWGEIGWTDVLVHLKEFNNEFQRLLQDRQLT